MEETKDFVEGYSKVMNRQPQTIAVGGKTYKVKQPRKFIRAKIDSLNREAYWCEQKAKGAITLKQAKKITRKIQTLHAKTAALYLLGLWAIVPFVYAIKWRWLMLGYDETTSAINTAGQTGDAQINFSLANWEYTKVQLARSINLIGEGLTDLQKRMESARKQAEEDAMKKKPDGK